MANKNSESKILEVPEEVTPVTPDSSCIEEIPLGDRIHQLAVENYISRRQSLVDTFTAAILSGVKFDLDGKMPNQEQRNKIVNLAVKMADDVIAATSI